jgi:hypothetical protein
MGEFVRIERDGAVATIRLDRPPANAFARPMSEELQAAAREVGADGTIRAVVVWGGERIFAAGADIKAIVYSGPDEIGPDVHALEQACRDLEAVPKPVIAAVNRFALGGGCEVALACDFRFAAEDAELGMTEITLGIIPAPAGPSGCPGWSAHERPRPDLDRSPRWGTRRSRWVWSTGSWPRRRSTRRRWRRLDGWPMAQPSPTPQLSGRSRRRLGRWTRVSRSSGMPSCRCSPLVTRRRACAPSSRSASPFEGR